MNNNVSTTTNCKEVEEISLVHEAQGHGLSWNKGLLKAIPSTRPILIKPMAKGFIIHKTL
jgi:hypothetical protein